MAAGQTCGRLNGRTELVREGSVSQRNGDKARFNRLRKSKIFRRKTIREFRKTLENNATRPTLAAPALVSITPLTVEPTG